MLNAPLDHTTCGLERAAGFEPATTCLGSKDSTTELRPLAGDLIQEQRLAVQLHVDLDFLRHLPSHCY